MWPRVGDVANVFDISTSLIGLYLYDTPTKYEAWSGITNVVIYSKNEVSAWQVTIVTKHCTEGNISASLLVSRNIL